MLVLRYVITTSVKDIRNDTRYTVYLRDSAGKIGIRVL